MRILFVHQNFPGQFKHLAPALAADPAHQVVALTIQAGSADVWQGVRIVRYQPLRGTTAGVHPWVADLETKTIRGEAALRAALQLRARGFVPDVIVAHPGWGESLFLKEVWPQARLGIYCEFYYHAHGADTGFDPEFDQGDIELKAARLHLKNTNNLLHMQVADGGISPTHWQADSFPRPFRDNIQVVHDGIDTDAIRPEPTVSLTLGGSLRLDRNDEIITFVNRNFEPYRGYHMFMRALPDLLRRRPRARVLMVGGDGVSYGAAAPDGRSWKDIFLAEVRDCIDLSRMHFLGNIAYAPFIALLQLSSVHVYWTYPFVLSWSLIEAMSAGCSIVASRTAPLLEVIEHGHNGRLVDFFDRETMVDEICGLLDDPQQRQRLGIAARTTAQERYDLQRICLPRQIEWVHSL